MKTEASITNSSSLVAMVATLTLTTTTLLPEPTLGSNDHSNVSLLWHQAEVQTLSERARIVLSQPVAILCLTLCLLSLLANSLSITATLLGPNGLVTHLKLVVSLGISDMLLSISTVSHLLNRIFNPVPSLSTPPEDRLAYACASTFHFALKTMAIVISLLNLLVMAMDHYVAIMNPLHYPTRLSRTKGTLIICVIWFLAFFGGCSVFVGDVSEFRKVSFYLNYCEYVQFTDYQGEYLVFAVAFLSLFVITYSYCRIYVEVRRTYRNGSNNRLDYARNRKALLTTLLIIGAFVFCWLPTCLFQIALLIQLRINKEMVQKMYATYLLVNRYLNALLLLNSLCDPIIYAFRLRDVQLGYRKLFQKCCFRRQIRYTSSFRSSMLRQTQIVHLPDTLQPHGAAQRSPSCSDSLALCLERGREEAEVTEVTPMMLCASAQVQTRNGDAVWMHHTSGAVGGGGGGGKGGGGGSLGSNNATTSARRVPNPVMTSDRRGSNGGVTSLRRVTNDGVTSERRDSSDDMTSGRRGPVDVVTSEEDLKDKLANVLCSSCDVSSCFFEKMSQV